MHLRFPGNQITSYRPLPSAIVWSPSLVCLVNIHGSHCMSCSDANPSIIQFVSIETSTITFITWDQTPIFFTLNNYTNYYNNYNYVKGCGNTRQSVLFFTILVLLHIHFAIFAYNSVSIYQKSPRYIGQCPAWLAVSTAHQML